MAEEQDQAQERTLPPTPKRRRDAAKKGQVLRSRELNTVLVTLGGAATLMAMGAGMLRNIREYMSVALSFGGEATRDMDGDAITQAMNIAREHGVDIVLPFTAVVVVLALAGPLMTGGVVFRINLLQPKFSNMSPLKGLKRMFGTRALVELIKAGLKFLLVAGMGIILFMMLYPRLLGLGLMPLNSALAEGGQMLQWFLVALSSVLIVVAAIDLPFQAFQHFKKLRMTRQEVQDELKETEGHPEVKRRIRSLQLQASQRKLEKVMPEAAVVITNPTHYAVALRYDDEVTTPIVLARGAGDVAKQLRTLAERFDIPIVSAPPLARALFFGVREGQEIPSKLYRAVAQVLIYVLQLGNPENRLLPPVITDEDIPPEMRRGEDE